MKPLLRILFLAILGLSACQGSLSEEQKKKIKDDMEAGKIQRVTEAEIIDGGFSFGRSLTKVIELSDKFYINRAVIDSLEQKHGVRIFKIQENDSTLFEIEKQILEAYMSGASDITLQDNVQITGTDSILYTKPILRSQPDGSLEFLYAIGIKASKRTIILSID